MFLLPADRADVVYTETLLHRPIFTVVLNTVRDLRASGPPEIRRCILLTLIQRRRQVWDKKVTRFVRQALI